MNAPLRLISPPMTNEDRLRNITRTYLHFKHDPKMVLPTPLMLLLEAGALALQDQENAQAEAGIRKDQRERLEGRTEPMPGERTPYSA